MDVENKFMVIRGYMGEIGRLGDWEIGTDIYILLYIK